MQIEITANAIITAGAVLGAVLAIGGTVFAVYRWYLKQEHQSKQIAELQEQHISDIQHINRENKLLCYAMSACLDGLLQLGCNHSVPDAKAALDKHLNEQAHE